MDHGVGAKHGARKEVVGRLGAAGMVEGRHDVGVAMVRRWRKGVSYTHKLVVLKGTTSLSWGSSNSYGAIYRRSLSLSGGDIRSSSVASGAAPMLSASIAARTPAP